MSEHDRSWSLRGRVLNAAKKEVSHAEIAVLWKRIRGTVTLARTTTTEEGTYEVHYSVPDDAPGPVLIVVEAAGHGLRAPLRSALTASAPKLVIDLMEEPTDSSEYALLLAQVTPLLGGLPLTALVEDNTHRDLSFLSQETGRSAEQIMQLCVAARLEEAQQISATCFYAFLAQHVPATLPVSLVDAAADFALIDALLAQVVLLIANLGAAVQTATLQAAVDKTIVTAEMLGDIAALVAKLQSLRQTQVLNTPWLTGKTSLGDLLGVAGLDQNKQPMLAQALADNLDSPARFWTRLADGTQGFTPAEVAATRQTLSLGILVKNSLPLVKTLNGQFTAGRLQTLPELATLSVADWEALVQEAGPEAVPANIAALGNRTAASVFAQETYDRVTRTYPTAALLHRAATTPLLPQQEQLPLAAFFRANPQLDLRRQNLSAYLKSTGDEAYGGVTGPDRDTLLTNVRGLQRLLRITPHVDTAARLLTLGIRSATVITTLGKQQFVTRLVGAGASATDAYKTYHLATQRYAGTVALWTQLRRENDSVWPAALGPFHVYDAPRAHAAEADPNLTVLFGSQDYCAVDSCTSLLSPAAYLTDLLMWLGKRIDGVSGGFPNALAVLLARRPDLGTLLLNCPNTQTQLPYIDLVNELLEDAVTPPAAGVQRQTQLGATELRAAPDPACLNAAAYVPLRTAKTLQTLPYDAPLDQLRTVLAQSNLALWQVRQGFLPLHGAPPKAQLEAIAGERFGISLGERLLITIADAAQATQATVWNTADPVNDLAKVSAFHAASGLSYDQILQLLQVVWIRNGGAPFTIGGQSDSCDTSAQSLGPLDLGRLDRIHRFLRLWRRTGWKMWELDLVLGSPAVSDASLSGQTIADLFAFQQLLDATRLPIDSLLTWFAKAPAPNLLDTASHLDPGGTWTTPLYTSLFADPASGPDPQLAVAKLDGTADLAAHQPAIQAALGLSAADAAALLALTDNKRTLANLSFLFNAASIATASRLSIQDALRLGPANFNTLFSGAAPILAFLKRAATLRSAGLTQDTLTYVITASPAKMQLSDAQTATLLGGVRTAMQKVHDSIHVSSQTAYQTLKTQLGQWPASGTATPSVSDPLQLAEAMQIVDGSFTGGNPARSSFITQQFGPFLLPAQLAAAIANLQPNPSPGTAYPQGAVLDTRVGYLLDPLEQYLTRAQVAATLAGALSMASDITSLLLTMLAVPAVPAIATRLLDALTEPVLIAPGAGGFGYAQDLTPGNFPVQFASLRLLHKESVLIGKLSLSLGELQWLLTNASAYGGVDLLTLPVLTAQPAQSVDALLATVLLVQLNRSFNAIANSTATPAPLYPDLFSMVAATKAGAFTGNDAAAQAALAAIAGAASTDLQVLAVALGLTVAAGDYLNPSSYDRVRLLLAMQKAANGSGTDLVSWANEPAPPADLSAAAASAQQALKSRYSARDWPAVAQSLNDPLRQHRRDALVAFLTAQRSGGSPMAWGTDSDSLFQYFLIDVEMSACMLTTRVVQAYAAVQLFVQRCLMNLEPNVQIDTALDAVWNEWVWRKRYRVWEADRQIFLYPENWLIEAQRPNKSEIFRKLEQDSHQQADTSDNLQTTVLAYIDGLDHVAHLRITGTCEDSVTGTRHVVARTHSDPPVYFHRTLDLAQQQWTPWTKIPLEIKAHQVVPAVYRRGVYLFWPQVAMANEPQQQVPAAAPTNQPQMSTAPARHVEISVGSSTWRNGAWTQPQWAAGRIFDVPAQLSVGAANSSTRAIEALYTLKIQLPATGTADMMVDIFRFGDNVRTEFFVGSIDKLRVHSREARLLLLLEPSQQSPTGLHIGRAVFDGRFNSLEMRNLPVSLNGSMVGSYLDHAQQHYGHDAEPLLELRAPAADLNGEPGLEPRTGALVTLPVGSGKSPQVPLQLTLPAGHGTETVLATALAPFRLVGDATSPQFDPTGYFFYSDPKRTYYVEATRYYLYGSQWRPVPPSNAATAPYQVRYTFTPFYHPFTRLLWHEIFNSGLPGIYNTALQTNPGGVDPSHADDFSFRTTYQPVSPLVHWGPDADVIDFSPSGAYTCYNNELFLHIPRYVAPRLTTNQNFEDAMAWYHYIFNPTLPGTDPQRFWIPAPLNGLTSAAVQQQKIDQILNGIHQSDSTALGQVAAWQKHPFDPFLVADLRPVAYMKAVVMGYLDNLIAWGDNLFTSASRENLNQATLLYVLAAQILGPPPQQVPPPTHADASFNTLQPLLDAFANALVDVENYVPPSNSPAPSNGGGGMPAPHTFYFKVPPNDKLLRYWSTVADRLFKLRHCQDISGQTLNLPLFDAPIDPGLLAAAQAAGVDLNSVLNDLAAPVPHYRYTYIYGQAQDFCNALRGYGAQLLAALEKKDAAALALLLAGLQQQLLTDANQIYQARVDQANRKLDGLSQSLQLQQARQNYYQGKAFTNAWEDISLVIQGTMIAVYGVAAVLEGASSVAHLFPAFLIGAAGFGGSPTASATESGSNAGHSLAKAANVGKAVAGALDRSAKMSDALGKYAQRQDDWNQKAKEAGFDISRLQAEIAAANLAAFIAQQDQKNHQTAIDNLQQQIDYLTTKFTSEDLYDWMTARLADTYFQSYQLGYKMAKRAERCYQYEIGLDTSSFIQFGYWDSLHKGLLAGESLAHDLRRLQNSYIELNARRAEISRIYLLSRIDPIALLTLLRTGTCFFSLPEALFDADYPGQYQRQVKRASITVVYTSPGKNDNVSCRLTMVGNRVRMNTQLNGNPDTYAEVLPGSSSDPRFHYQYAGAQSIVISQAQDDPALFENNVHYQINDPRYLPFEGAGTISDWKLELPSRNEIDITTVSDIQLHLLFTALDGDTGFMQAAQQSLDANAPTSGSRLFSAANDFPAPSAPGSVSPWQSFFAPAAGTDQVLTLPISASKLPAWTRGKAVTINKVTAYALSWGGGSFVLEPQPGPPTNSQVTLAPVAGPAPVLVAAGVVGGPAVASLGNWSFKVKAQGAADFHSLKSSQLSDLILQVDFSV